MQRVFFTFCFMLTCVFGIAAELAEEIEFRPEVNDAPIKVTGEILVEAQDGGVLMLADDGYIWTIQPNQIVKRNKLEVPMTPVSTAEMKRRLMEQNKGFEVYQTAHYIILHNTNERYAKRVGTLFEQLYKGFFAYWENQGWELPEPRFPFVAMVFANRDDYLQYSLPQVGETAKAVLGYYDLRNNRMITYFNRNLERNIATLVHEATHQLAYNCKVQTRYADNPKWVSEGLAMFFESPDFKSPKGWRAIGKVNQVNLSRWRNYQRNRPAESLVTLLADDSRFNNASTALAAYGESWALTYFLIKTRREKYVSYLRELSKGKRLIERTKKERIEMFESSFGETIVGLDKAFVTYMRRIR